MSVSLVDISSLFWINNSCFVNSRFRVILSDRRKRRISRLRTGRCFVVPLFSMTQTAYLRYH